MSDEMLVNVLIASLRALAAAQHDDLSVAADAADEIERLRRQYEKGVVALVMIERMAAGGIYSQESIHAVAVAALKEISEDGCRAQTG